MLAPFVGLSLSVVSVVWLTVVMFLLSFALTGLGFLIAWRMDSTQGFHAIMNLFLIPLWLLSGAVFPASGAPAILRWAMMCNPVSYGVMAVPSGVILECSIGNRWIAISGDEPLRHLDFRGGDVHSVVAGSPTYDAGGFAMKVKTILNIGVAGTFATVVGSILLIVIRGAPIPASAMEVPVMGWVPEFSLTEASGTTVRRGDLIGKVWIASFLFTRCGEACPLLMHHEVRLQGELPVRDDLQLVSFSVRSGLGHAQSSYRVRPRVWRGSKSLVLFDWGQEAGLSFVNRWVPTGGARGGSRQRDADPSQYEAGVGGSAWGDSWVLRQHGRRRDAEACS